MLSATLPIGDRALTADQVLSLVSKHRLVPQLAREMVITEAIEHHPISEAEHLAACKTFYQQQQLQSEQDLEQWLQRQRLAINSLGISFHTCGIERCQLDKR